LIDAQTKKQQKRVAAIKQKCNWEESKHMWYLIKQTAKVLEVISKSGRTISTVWLLNTPMEEL
jgi:hypothetical protein